jgi:uncharacterized membrane protein YfcA
MFGISPKAILFALLALSGIGFVAYWRSVERGRAAGAARRARPGLVEVAIGVVTDFFDALGIGSFATTTSLFRFWRVVPDEQIPGTLNVGHTLPTLAEAFIFIAVVEVEMTTLALMIASSVVGAWLGAGVVVRWSLRKIQVGMGSLLLVAAAIIVLRQLNLVPGGGDALGLHGIRLFIGCAGNMVLGALMMLGIGLFAPCMILVTFLGMRPLTALPIMMGSCAFLMLPAGARFVRAGRYDLRASLGLTLGGVPAALVAGLVVGHLPLDAVKWLVAAVVVYTGVTMLRSAAASRRNANNGAANG